MIVTDITILIDNIHLNNNDNNNNTTNINFSIIKKQKYLCYKKYLNVRWEDLLPKKFHFFSVPFWKKSSIVVFVTNFRYSERFCNPT